MSAPRIKIFSHVRSGTHFLEAFLAKNFYKNQRLAVRPVKWGHWSNRKTKLLGNKYGQLFGSHLFPEQIKSKLDEGPCIYIYRDGRAVAASVWRTPNFLNKSWYPISFSDFLHKELDWYGSPSIKARTDITIIEHWIKHTSKWKTYKHENLMLVRYEELVRRPEAVAERIREQFSLIPPRQIVSIDRPTGLLPSKSSKSGWKQVWSKKDMDFFNNLVAPDYFARYDSE